MTKIEINDKINGCFELAGAVAAAWNCYTIFVDKSYSGVSIMATACFMLWGLWNIYYYKELNQGASWYAAIVLTSFNVLYVLLLIYYGKG